MTSHFNPSTAHTRGQNDDKSFRNSYNTLTFAFIRPLMVYLSQNTVLVFPGIEFLHFLPGRISIWGLGESFLIGLGGRYSRLFLSYGLSVLRAICSFVCHFNMRRGVDDLLYCGHLRFENSNIGVSIAFWVTMRIVLQTTTLFEYIINLCK